MEDHFYTDDASTVEFNKRDDFNIDLENAESYNSEESENTEQADCMSIDEIIQKNVSKSIRDLRTFLSGNFITEKGDQSTNIINVSEKKTFNIPETHIEQFFEKLDACRKEHRMIHFSERQETSNVSKSGIMIDFDRYQRSKEQQINERHFESLTRHISKLLNEFIDFSAYATNDTFVFRMFYIRKPSVVLQPQKVPGQAPLYKDGFHILIPEIQVTKGLKRHLLQELISRGIMKSVFRDIDHIDDPAKMLDKMSASNPVHFLGNSKPGKPAYPLTHVYEMTIYTAEDDIDRKLLDVETINSGIVKPLEANPIPINLTYELSLSFYLQSFNGQPTWLRKFPMDYRAALETKIQLLVEKSAKDILPEDDIMQAENSVDILTMGNPEAGHLKKMLEILDISFATEYEKWFKVICAIAYTNVNYKPLAVWFSHRKPESWSPAEIDRVWIDATNGRFSRTPVTKRSIMFWAEKSSPQRYREIKNENYFQVLARGVYDNEGRVEHALAAKVCYSMIGDKFVVDVGVNEKSGRLGYCWFEFVVPGQSMRKGEVFKWRREVEPDNIHLYIGEHMPKLFTELVTNIKDKKDNAANEGEMKYWANVERNFRMSKSRLGNDQFQNGVIRQAQYKFRQRGFMDELDAYEEILGVGNGVLKIGPEPMLIKGFHEYKISKFTETDYIAFDPENPYIKTLLKAFHDIFPEDDVFEFMLYHASTGLDFKESACLLLLLVGGGQNGKSFFAKMVHNTLGNMYCAAGKSALLTAPMEKSESANSAQMQMKDKRYFYFDEFNKCELLNTGRVKAIVNPGWQSGRDLHSRQGNFKNTCNPIALSNFDFIIDTTDHGTWRRIAYYRNKVKFCKNPNPNNPFEKEVNSKFIDEYTNDPLYKQAMLSIMVHYYSKLCRDYSGDIKNVSVPTIERETEEFRNRQDALNRFITQMIVKSPEADPVGLPSLASKYIEWYNKNIKPTNQTIIDVQAQFENSRIASTLERGLSGIMFLVNHRVKSSPEEPLGEDETELSVNAPSSIVSVVKNPNIIIPEITEEDDAFVRDLIRNAPNYIQTREEGQTDNIEIEDVNVDILINDVLSDI
ncbi:putative helicase [Pacmanvirus S19]|nr:putative helicase [Pacmanvirus S19]